MAKVPNSCDYAYICFKHSKNTKIVKESLLNGSRPLDLNKNYLYYDSSNSRESPVFDKSLYKRKEGVYDTPVNYRVRVLHSGSMASCIEAKTSQRIKQQPKRFLVSSTDVEYNKMDKIEKKRRYNDKKAKTKTKNNAKILNSIKIKNLITTPIVKGTNSTSSKDDYSSEEDSNNEVVSSENYSSQDEYDQQHQQQIRQKNQSQSYKNYNISSSGKSKQMRHFLI